MLGFALAGPSTAKRARARLEGVRERYSQSDAVRAQVQMKRLVAQRDNRLDDMMNRFVPNPALLKQRLERTGKEWQLGRYVAVSLGIAMLTALAATAGGVPLILAIMLGMLAGIALPHKAASGRAPGRERVCQYV